jgi:hypothetical protein
MTDKKVKKLGCLSSIVYVLLFVIVGCFVMVFNDSSHKNFRQQSSSVTTVKEKIPNSELPLSKQSIDTKTDLTPEVIAAITQKQPRDPADFERYVLLFKYDISEPETLIRYEPYGDQAADIKPEVSYFAIPVAYMMTNLSGYTDYEKPPWRMESSYPLDAYQLPKDPANDRHDNGVLRWQPMMINGEQKMVYRQEHGQARIVLNIMPHLAYHYPDLLPVDREMYQSYRSLFNRRRGEFAGREFPKYLNPLLDPLTIVATRVAHVEGYYHFNGPGVLRQSRNYIRGIPDAEGYHRGVFPVDDGTLKFRGDLITKQGASSTNFYSQEGDDPGMDMYCDSKPEALKIMYSCLGSAYFESIGMAHRFSYRRSSVDSIEKWQDAIGAANKMLERWKVNNVDELELSIGKTK